MGLDDDRRLSRCGSSEVVRVTMVSVRLFGSPTSSASWRLPS